MNDIVLTAAQAEIKLPFKNKNKSGWFIECKNNGIWQSIDFNLLEDAWSFYYSRLNEIKRRILGLERQK